jgi:hypothetical protein
MKRWSTRGMVSRQAFLVADHASPLLGANVVRVRCAAPGGFVAGTDVNLGIDIAAPAPANTWTQSSPSFKLWSWVRWARNSLEDCSSPGL